jgi:hypothetical protein
MEGQNVFDFVFRKKNHIEKMGHKPLVESGLSAPLPTAP